MKKRIFCAALALALVLTMMLVGCNEKEATPQFTPPPFDPAATVGTPTVPEGLGYKELDANGVYKLSVCGAFSVADGKADLWLTNPESNTVLLKIRVYDKTTGAVLGETGLVRPGEYVKSVEISSAPPKGTAIVLRVMSYQPDTYYSMGEVTLNTQVS